MSETRKFLTETEIEAFFKAARKTRNGVRDHCMAMMAYRHGFRVSELIDIRLDEIHLDTARLDVRRLKKGLSGHHPIEGDELRAIRAWMKERSAHKFSGSNRSEEHTSELQSRGHLVCRLLLEKKK